MPSMRRAIDKIVLEECLICFKMYGDGKNIYVLWDMMFVIYIRNTCGKYVWIVCEECVCKIYGSMRDMEVKYSIYLSL